MPPGLDGMFASENTSLSAGWASIKSWPTWPRICSASIQAYITGMCVTIDGGEWLRGAGEFNALESVSSEQWDALQAAMKPKKK